MHLLLVNSVPAMSKKVVIIGSSHAGIGVAQALGPAASVQLIDRKDFFEVTWAAVRAGSVDPNLADSTLAPHQDIPNVGGKVIVGETVAITEQAVQLKDGREVPYDHLVFAVGSLNGGAAGKGSDITLQDRKNTLKASCEKVEASKTVLVVGGGPTGVEVAAEIITAYPDKKVTLVHSGAYLLAPKGAAYGKKAFNFLTSKGVKVILNDRVESSGGTAYNTVKGQERLPADHVFWCTGNQLATGWIKAAHPEILNEQGLIKVEGNLRVKGHSNWWAVGDCNDVKEVKQGYLASEQGKVMGKNLRTLLEKGDTEGLVAYKPFNGMDVQIVSLGRKQGLMYVKGWSFSGCIPTNLKSKDLMVGRTRSTIGLKAR